MSAVFHILRYICTNFKYMQNSKYAHAKYLIGISLKSKNIFIRVGNLLLNNHSK